MSWTNDKPIAPGWYWFRRNQSESPRVLQIAGDPLAFLYQNGLDGIVTGAGVPAGEWCGPIEPPAD